MDFRSYFPGSHLLSTRDQWTDSTGGRPGLSIRDAIELQLRVSVWISQTSPLSPPKGALAPIPYSIV